MLFHEIHVFVVLVNCFVDPYVITDHPKYVIVMTHYDAIYILLMAVFRPNVNPDLKIASVILVNVRVMQIRVYIYIALSAKRDTVIAILIPINHFANLIRISYKQPYITQLTLPLTLDFANQTS